ncbi:hypothetical protein TanjilG_09887 [Lupinus angustifolius]|uniref:Uncharacterized protein n=1 Tax=Lupinus angustifolius TaxID=3871 RepID=A0A1J7GCW7_LUPAN|nr:PREDICTED: uncharacterized protein LOC109326535 [Lupinus angustifolius]OIV98235.1 hypothetical protein TanjilG_09887 [Lupinus angustifolius]
MVDVKHQMNTFAVSVTATLAVLAKQASRLPRKLKTAVTEPALKNSFKFDLKSPKLLFRKPKNLLKKMSNKTMSFIHKKKKKNKEGEEWGDGGVWQKEIMMGDKCEPLDFSGLICYNSKGKQVNKIL